MYEDDLDLELPDFLNRKLNGIVPELAMAKKAKGADEILWPSKEINRALRLKARNAKLRRKELKAERDRKADYTT